MRSLSYLTFFSVLGTFAIQAPEYLWDQKFSERIQDWIATISYDNPNLSHWVSCSWYSQSLGPNSRQWLITLIDHNQIVGYLVIGVDNENEPLLLDYGEGSFPFY